MHRHLLTPGRLSTRRQVMLIVARELSHTLVSDIDVVAHEWCECEWV